MDNLKSFDELCGIIDRQSSNDSAGIIDDVANEQFLKFYCEIIDSIYERFSGVSRKITINEEKNEIEILITCKQFEIDEPDDEFNLLLRNAKRFEVMPGEKDYVKINFIFKGIWMSD